jgi:hypothetical protein
VLVTFLDIDEDGRLDLMMQTVSASGKHQIICIYNNWVKDAFFIKAMMISNQVGVYGHAISGASYRVIGTDLEDKKFVILAT